MVSQLPMFPHFVLGCNSWNGVDLVDNDDPSFLEDDLIAVFKVTLSIFMKRHRFSLLYVCRVRCLLRLTESWQSSRKTPYQYVHIPSIFPSLSSILTSVSSQIECGFLVSRSQSRRICSISALHDCTCLCLNIVYSVHPTEDLLCTRRLSAYYCSPPSL